MLSEFTWRQFAAITAETSSTSPSARAIAQGHRVAARIVGPVVFP